MRELRIPTLVTSDTQFCDCLQEGKDMSNCQFDDMFAYGHLPDPPRTPDQFAAGVAAGAEHERLPKLLFLFVDNPKGRDGYPDEFRAAWTKPWGFMFGRQVFTQNSYEQYLEKQAANRALLTWKGVVQVPRDGVSEFLESLYVPNFELVMQNVQRKQKQSQVAKKRNAEQEAQAAQNVPTGAASSSAQAHASSSAAPAPVPVPKTPPKSAPATSSGRPDASRRGGDQSWSWNRDHYSSRREWSFYRGQWYYRDEAAGRSIYWGR